MPLLKRKPDREEQYSTKPETLPADAEIFSDDDLSEFTEARINQLQRDTHARLLEPCSPEEVEELLAGLE